MPTPIFKNCERIQPIGKTDFQLLNIVEVETSTGNNTGSFAIARYRYLDIATKKHIFHEYLSENKIIFENILGCESRA